MRNYYLLRIETCDKGAFCGAWENVRYQNSNVGKHAITKQ